MLSRLKRPGYIAIALIVVVIYFYGQYKKIELKRHQEAIINSYKSYGEDILDSIKAGDFSKIQSSFEIDKSKNLTLEDIATFIETLHLDRIGDAKWTKIETNSSNISMSGDLVVDRNITYPIDMMIVKRGNKLILKRMIVNGKALQTKRVNFPLNIIEDSNDSNSSSQILIKKCPTLQKEINSPYIYETNSTNSTKK
jgi:hypothetical protein